MSAVVADVDRAAVTAAGGPRYDAVIAGLCLLFQGGAYLDVWAHVHRPELETFFTPWHAVLYSGFLAVAIATATPLVLRRRTSTTMSWSSALPAGYDWSLIGVLVFLLGGVLDMLWHVVFGIEADVEALLSPSHLVLAVGSTLILTGPLRAAWRRVDRAASWPAVLSLAFLLSSFSFWTQYAHHFGRPWPAAGNRPTVAEFVAIAPDPLFRNAPIQNLYVAHALGVSGILLQAVFMSAIVLLALRRWGPRLPYGTFAVILGLNAVMVAAARDQLTLVPGAVAAGLISDALVRALRPSIEQVGRLRIVAFAIPATYFGLYFLGIALTRGVWWSVPLWSGTIVLSGAVGWLASWLVVPPPIPREIRS